MASRVEVMLKLTADVEKTVVALAVNVHAELVERTPFDTGWARANWIPYLGGPPPVTVEHRGDPASAKAAAESGLASILVFKLADGSIFVSNHVPYITRLDAGSSTQAPAGFVRAAVAKAILDTGSGRLGAT